MPNAGKKTRAKNTPTMQEFMVLAALRKSGGEFVDMLTVAQVLRHRTQVDMAPTSLYPVMYRLEKLGLVFRTEEKRPRGESRHFYTLTEEGHANLTLWLGRMTALL